MSDLFEAAAQAEREAVRLLLPRLRSDEAIQRRNLNDAMTKAFGGSDADGRWTQRASFELLEHALAIHLQSSALKIAAFGDVRALIDLSDRLPTQTVRSEDQIEWQQFSTPVDIAAVMTLLANVQPDDIVLEPSAGIRANGGWRSMPISAVPNGPRPRRPSSASPPRRACRSLSSGERRATWSIAGSSVSRAASGDTRRSRPII